MRLCPYCYSMNHTTLNECPEIDANELEVAHANGREYAVLVTDPINNREWIEYRRASTYSEAFAMIERAYAGNADYLYGVPLTRPDAVHLAREEEITFNEADGLLID